MSFDEAWYGDIARNLLHSKNPFKLIFNGQVFTDHPPFGFMLMSISMMIFGVNEFSVRLISVLSGVGSVLLLFLIGKKVGGRMVGFISAIILFSSMWFVFRVRSGNLDIPFLFFELMTIFFLLQKKKIYLAMAIVSFSALVLTKTLVGFGILPVMIFLLWQNKKNISKKIAFQLIFLFLIIVLPWYVYNQILDDNFLYHHFFEIGSRGDSNKFDFSSLKQSLFYLSIGVGKWYKVFLISVSLAVINFIRQKNKFNYKFLFLWFLGFMPFLLSSRAEIWHFIPIYPIVALLIPVSINDFLAIFFKKNPFIEVLLIFSFVIIGVYQFRQFSNLMYFPHSVKSDEKDIALKSKNYDNIHLLETFYPAMVFYTQKHIVPLNWEEDSHGILLNKLDRNTDDVFVINTNLKSQLEREGIDFVVLEKNDSYYLIKSNKDQIEQNQF